MDIGKRIKDKRLELKLTLENVGDYVGVGKSTVRKWETGDIENMKTDKLARLAYILQVSPLYIIGMIDTPHLESVGMKIPLLGTIAAGQPILAEENVEDYFTIDKRIHADFALRIKGDSMINVNIMHGDIVFIRQQDTLENGQIGAILVDNEATLKRFYKMDGHVLLQAENPDFKPIMLDGDNIKILGKMVANLRQFQGVIKK